MQIIAQSLTDNISISYFFYDSQLNMKKCMKLQLQAVKDKAESEQSERIKSESGLCSALDRQDSKQDLKCQARAYINPCLLDCRFVLCSPTKLAGVCYALANTPAVGDKVQC